MAYNVPLSSINASDGNVTYAQGAVLRVGAGGNVNAVGSVVIDSNNRLGIGVSAPQTILQTNARVIDDNAFSYDPQSVYFVHQTPTSSTALNDPRTILLLARQGTNGQAFGAAAEFRLSRYENSGTNSRTRLDISLADGGFLTDRGNVVTMISSGNVGIGTTSPSVRLEVSGTGKMTQVDDSKGDVRTLVVNSQGAGYILQASDHGKLIDITTGGVTVPSGVFSVGQNITIYNDSAVGQTITQGASVTLRLAGTATTGNRTLAQRGICTVVCVASNEFVISGAGLA